MVAPSKTFSSSLRQKANAQHDQKVKLILGIIADTVDEVESTQEKVASADAALKQAESDLKNAESD